jgi:hypothetical protein
MLCGAIGEAEGPATAITPPSVLDQASTCIHLHVFESARFDG